MQADFLSAFSEWDQTDFMFVTAVSTQLWRLVHSGEDTYQERYDNKLLVPRFKHSRSQFLLTE